MADVLPEQTQLPGYGSNGFVPAGLVAPAGFDMPAEFEKKAAPVGASPQANQTPPAAQNQMQMPQQMQGQPMNGQQMQQPMNGQQMQQPMNGQPMNGQQMNGQMNGQQMSQMNAQGQQMVMMPMQNNMQQMQNGQMPQMMQQFVPMMQPGFDQNWGGQQMMGQQPTGWVFVPMATLDGQNQMMYDGNQMMGQQMMYNNQQMPHQQQQPHVFLRPQDDQSRRGGKQWRGRRGKEDGRRPFHGDSHKVFVGGLGPATSAKTLRAYFAQFGMLLDAAVIADGATRRSRGFGFVEFAGGIPEGVLEHEHLIENRRCGVRPYTYRQGPGVTIDRGTSNSHNSNSPGHSAEGNSAGSDLE